jgi:UPF0755 protein
MTVCLVAVALAACREPDPDSERLVVPAGATLDQIADTLAVHDVIRWPALFVLYVRLQGADKKLKAGIYDFPRGASWSVALEILVMGRVAEGVTLPEGWRIAEIANRIGPIAGLSPDSAAERLLDAALADSLGAPGPTLEGYLFPATYEVRLGERLESIAALLFARYRQLWTPARRARLDSLGISEREAVTLASIIQAESRWEDEMPLISAVFHNRLRQEMRLQADPTVRYALPPNTPLRYTDIDSLTDHPYNTYSHDGLPPGPICSPGEAAIDAALHPAPVDYLFFVARQDGRHEFSRTFGEHRGAIERNRPR